MKGKTYVKYTSKERGSYLDSELTKGKLYKILEDQFYGIPVIENDFGMILEIIPSHMNKFEILEDSK